MGFVFFIGGGDVKPTQEQKREPCFFLGFLGSWFRACCLLAHLGCPRVHTSSRRTTTFDLLVGSYQNVICPNPEFLRSLHKNGTCILQKLCARNPVAPADHRSLLEPCKLLSPTQSRYKNLPNYSKHREAGTNPSKKSRQTPYVRS